MTTRNLSSVLAAGFGLVLSGWVSPAVAQASPLPHPFLVELFSSQSCGACPHANQMLIEMAETDPNVFPIVWSVDYWEYMGVQEPYAEPEFLDRQHTYVDRFQLRGPYTPQVVVDGCAQTTGLSGTSVYGKLLHVALEPDPGVTTQMTENTVSVSTRDAAASANIWLVGYIPGITTFTPDEGVSSGRELPHLNLATSLDQIGIWDGVSETDFSFECEAEACLIIVQEEVSQEVLHFGLVPPSEPEV